MWRGGVGDKDSVRHTPRRLTPAGRMQAITAMPLVPLGPVHPPKRVGIVERNWRWVFACGTGFLDAALLVIASVATPMVIPAEWWTAPPVPASVAEVAGLIVLYVATGALFGLYRHPYAASIVSQLRAARRAYIVGTAIVLFVYGVTLQPPSTNWLIWAVVVAFPVLFCVGRIGLLALRARLQRMGWAVDRTILITSEDVLPVPPTWLSRARTLGYELVGVISIHRRQSSESLTQEVDRLVEATGARCLLVVSPTLRPHPHRELSVYARVAGLKLRIIAPEDGTAWVATRLHDVAGITLEAPTRFKMSRMKLVAKRCFDLVMAAGLLFLFSPVLLLVAIAIKLESKGPVFFLQSRSLSKRSVPFQMYKFRSMRHDSDELKATLEHANETSGALFKIRDDPRLTRVGRLIRRFSLDEFPQLINVLKGDMSLVGPRPLPVADFDRLDEVEAMDGLYERRALVKPGMTGLWQISGRSDVGFREMILLDLYYVENHSVLFDLEILAETAPTVLAGRGAY